MTTLAAQLAASNASAAPETAKEPAPSTRKPIQVTQEGDVEAVEVDGLALLKIVKHCTSSPIHPPPAGQIVGLNTSGLLAVSDAFPLPPNHLFPPSMPDELREKDRDAARRRDEAFSAAAHNAHVFSVPILRRMGDLSSDALNGTVGFYMGIKDGVVVGQNGGIVEALLKYQLGSDASRTRPGAPRAPSATISPRRGVALVYDVASAKQGVISLRAFRLTDTYINLYRSLKSDSQSADVSLLPSDILKEYPVTITRSALLNAFLTHLTDTSGEPSNAPLDLPSPGRGLEQPLSSLLTNLEQAVNSMGNLRYRDRRNKGVPGDALDAIKGLAASDGAARSLNESAGVDLVRTFGARTEA